MSAAPATSANVTTRMSGRRDGFRPPAGAASGFAFGLTAAGGGATGAASTGVNMRVKSLGPLDPRAAGADDGAGGGANGSTRCPDSSENSLSSGGPSEASGFGCDLIVQRGRFAQLWVQATRGS